jgi:hypothetical protein
MFNFLKDFAKKTHAKRIARIAEDDPSYTDTGE